MINSGVYVRYEDGRPPVWQWTAVSKQALKEVANETGMEVFKVKERVWRVEILASLVLNSMLPEKMAAQLTV